ncbi:MAG: ABC transporter permease [Chloroflexi bacterium]|nr:ABC transporter permease [Chloroflexota bacterium]
MKNTWLVLRQEVISTVTRRSFQLTAFGIPLISALLFAAISLLNSSAPGAVSGILNPAQPSLPIPEGFVDQSGLIETIPDNVSENDLRAYQDEASAKNALLSGEISAYYLIPEDYLARGQVVYVSGDFNPMDAFKGGSLIDQVLQVNLLEGDVHLANIVTNPFALQVMILNPTNRLNQDSSLAFFVPYSVMLLYYMLILMSAGFLVSSLNKERESRVLEIMLVTVTPRQLLGGKFIGLGLMGLLVNILWVGSAYGLMVLSGSTFQLPAEFQLAPYILVWGVVYFLLGYAVYASLLGAVGAMLPNLRETSQATMVVILPMIIPLMFISLLIAQPNGLLAVGLSLFPLTAPVTMMLRLAVITVPAWQLTLSVVILLLTAIFILRAVASMFHAQTMLSGQPLSLRNIYRMILGKV